MRPAGPAFAMTAQPRRDELGRSMAQKSTASLKRRSELHATTPLRQALQASIVAYICQLGTQWLASPSLG